MSDTDVGGIVAYLRLDPSDWKREAAEADAAIEKLEGRDPRVHISVDGAAAAVAKVESVVRAENALLDANERVRRAEVNLAEVRKVSDAGAERTIRAENDVIKARRDAAVAQMNVANATQRAEAQLAKLNDTQDKNTATTKREQQNFQALLTSIVALGPAVVPIAAGAAGLALAFGAMGAAGFAAFKGVQEQMAEATPVGRAFSDGVDDVVKNFDKLTETAAPRVLASFEEGVIALNGEMPRLNALTGELATVTGHVALNLLTGLLGGLNATTPLIEDGAVAVNHLSQEFTSLMNGGGVNEFGDYARSVLPQVVQVVEELAVTAGHLVTAFAPLGGGVLTAVDTLAQALNAIPLPVLTTLATVAPAAFLGFKTAGAVTAGVESLSTALTGMGAAGERAAVGVRSLEAAAGPIGLAIAAATLALTYFSEQSRQGQQAVNDLTDAFKQSHGAIDQHIRDMQYTALQESGAIDAAKALGLSLNLVTQAALGSSPAMQAVQTQMNAMYAAAVNNKDLGAGQVSDLRVNIETLETALGGSNAALVKGKQGYLDYAAAMAPVTGATTEQSSATQQLAAMLHTTAAVVDATQQKQAKNAQTTSEATLQMQLQNDAAGLLKQALDALNGKVINVEEAQTRTAQATLNATTTIKDNKHALDLSTAAGIANRGALESVAQAAQAQALAVAQQTGSQQRANSVILTTRDNLLAQLRAQGQLTPAIQDYVTKLFSVPKTVPTVLQLQAAQAQAALAAFRSNLQQVNGMTATTYVNTIVSGSARKLAADVVSGAANANGSITLAGGVRAMAAGDVLGPGRGAMVTSKPILWGEAGPEAYIPLSPGAKRPRAEQLLAATNEAMGDPLGAKSGPQVTNHIYEATDAHETAQLVSQKTMFALASGG